nr:aminoglycoside phosphotransferase family protein [Petropleomorpha daqingensis]
MHADEVGTDVDLVRRLLAGQFPQWAELPLRPVPSSGTDNALYRLGADMVVRLPRIGWAVTDVEAEQRRLRSLAPHLPLPIPEPLAAGAPGAGYPWSWSVYRWLAGEEARADRLPDPVGTAEALAGFVGTLHGIEVADPPAGGGRGGPLAARDAATRAAIAALDGELDSRAVTAVWEQALAAPVRDAPPVWVHADLAPGNLLLREGRVVAVLDFGALTVGDPAVDLLVAWNLFSGAARERYRAVLGVDDATWARGRGWAVSVALIALPYYRHTNPALVAQSWRTLREVLAG